LNIVYEDCTETLTSRDMLGEIEATLNKVIEKNLHPDALVERQSRMIVLDTRTKVSTILYEDEDVRYAA